MTRFFTATLPSMVPPAVTTKTTKDTKETKKSVEHESTKSTKARDVAYRPSNAPVSCSCVFVALHFVIFVIFV